MDVFEVRYSDTGDELDSSHERGHISVTAQDVQVMTKTTLLPVHIAIFIFFGSFGIWLLSLLFSVVFEYSIKTIFQWYIFLPGIGLLFVAALPIRQRQLTLSREDISTCEAHAREVIIDTSQQQIDLTLPTSDDAQML